MKEDATSKPAQTKYFIKSQFSWVVWEEGKGPDVVIELLSESTAPLDKNEKKLIYQNQLRVPEYFCFDPFNPDDWAGFFLQKGVYQSLMPNSQNQLVSQLLGLALVRWHGNYKGINTTWLRWANLDGELLATPEEIAEQAKQRAQQAESKLQQTVLNLLQEGMTVEQVTRLTGLSESEIEII